VTVALGEIIQTDAPIPTWFGVGGRADMLATPRTVDELRDLVQAFAGQTIRVFGDGANLLVDDDGVDGLVIDLRHFSRVDYRGFDPSAGPPDRATEVIIEVGAGARLPKLITETVRHGLAGLETLGGIPASVGGAVYMNAGGAFGQIADAVESVHALSRLGQMLVIPHDQINFDYRHSGLGWMIITSVEFHLTALPEERAADLRRRLLDVMAYKKNSQPMAENSAGCVFKNPTIDGERVSAGMLIDRSGCKGLTVGGARVSDVHANFIVTEPGCTARDVIALMARVRAHVAKHHGATLEPEVVVWRRSRS
jgi:UDP-N-acetylmuramate dehydrogenase